VSAAIDVEPNKRPEVKVNGKTTTHPAASMEGAPSLPVRDPPVLRRPSIMKMAFYQTLLW
jgi:hypothetical protein